MTKSFTPLISEFDCQHAHGETLQASFPPSLSSSSPTCFPLPSSVTPSRFRVWEPSLQNLIRDSSVTEENEHADKYNDGPADVLAPQLGVLVPLHASSAALASVTPAPSAPVIAEVSPFGTPHFQNEQKDKAEGQKKEVKGENEDIEKALKELKGKGVEIKKGPKELGREKLELETVKTQSNSELEEIPLVIPLQVDPTQRSISQRIEDEADTGEYVEELPEDREHSSDA